MSDGTKATHSNETTLQQALQNFSPKEPTEHTEEVIFTFSASKGGAEHLNVGDKFKRRKKQSKE